MGNSASNVQFSYEPPYGGNLPVNQNRGPLAGTLVGQFPSTYVNFFQVSFIWGSGERNPATERTEAWRVDGDGYTADFLVTVKGAPATIKGAMTLFQAGAGSTLDVNGSATVAIPLFGSKIEGVIVKQLAELLAHEEKFTKSRLPG